MDTLPFIVALGAIAAGFVQGLSGFGFGLVAMSVWAWVVDPRLAAAMAVFGALSGQLVAATTVRRTLNLRQLLPFLAGGIVGIPVGVAILPLLDQQMFKAGLGLFLVIWCPFMLMARQLPRITAGGRVADGVAGAMGGLMGGIGGFAGTVPTLWCALRGFDKDTQRAVVQNFNLATLLVTMGIYIAKGIVTRDMLPMFAIIAPAMLVPTLIGARLYVGISEGHFRKLVLSLLTASGIALLAATLPKMLGA